MFKQKLDEFLRGRYGGDSLNSALGVFSLVSLAAAVLVFSFVQGVAGTVIGIALLVIAAGAQGLAIFRVFSKDLTARRAEYEWYRRNVKDPVKKLFSGSKNRPKADSEHRLFKCPKCRQTVRVPRGKGRIRITCPKCGETFIKKT